MHGFLYFVGPGPGAPETPLGPLRALSGPFGALPEASSGPSAHQSKKPRNLKVLMKRSRSLCNHIYSARAGLPMLVWLDTVTVPRPPLSCSMGGVGLGSVIERFHLETLRVAEVVPHLGLGVRG